jgi:MarR family transcriptional regulator, negative regulator of the multidrug operon emrRAB
MSHAHIAREANLVGALALAVGDRIAEAADPALRGSAAEALVTLAGAGAGGTIDSLAKVAGLTHSGAVRLVDRLVRAGLVERRVGADQRSAALFLTPPGRRAARRVLTRREAAIQSVIAPFTRTERQALARLAEKLLAELGDERRTCRLCDVEACGRLRGACPMNLRSNP